MPIEVEKKYNLTKEQFEKTITALKESNAHYHGEEFEENTLFKGKALEGKHTVLRLRRVNQRAILTYKQRLHSDSPIKFQHEDETEIADAEAMNAILFSLGFIPSLVYEKRRKTWDFESVEIVLDELPFGYYMEIEGEEDRITETEKLFGFDNFEAEEMTYPSLTLKFGRKNGDLIEARFEKS